jgi:hypothetical protein
MELVVNCRHDAFDVYVGRASGPRGRWGNPFSHLSRTRAQFRVANRDEAISAHRLWLWEKVCAGEVSLEELASLDGQVLGCWCAPLACHAETLVRAARWAREVLADEVKFDRGSDEPPF